MCQLTPTLPFPPENLPAHAAYFSIFESMKIILGADKTGHRPIQAAGCGATAAFAHDIFMTPFDTVKQRMQLGYYKNVLHCIRSVAAKEGVRAFYLSMPTTLAMNLPYGSVMVAVNESARKLISPGDGKISTSTSLMAGSIAGAVAAMSTTPLDVIKTRLQTQNLEPCPKVIGARVGNVVVTKVVGAGAASAQPSLFGSTPRLEQKRGFAEVISQVYRDEGWKGFTRGMTARILLHTPAVAISWTAYETIKDLLTTNRR